MASCLAFLYISPKKRILKNPKLITSSHEMSSAIQLFFVKNKNLTCGDKDFIEI